MCIAQQPATCGDCEYAFEHGIGYDSHICDIDTRAITQLSDDCPLKRIAVQEVA